MKKLMNLKGAQPLSIIEQKEIKGGAGPILLCQIGCVGKSRGDNCYASGVCECPGRCGGTGANDCTPF
ncbi:hypothetical protein [uncultured Dokdonia sp.]|uniref:hypothetical protein n=1 Tax=uncultured Dokdonia sp. TaxID=575653 RepID=UPI00261DC874|nr:hypothetical protein [uncultured Dokdonia sp.]